MSASGHVCKFWKEKTVFSRSVILNGYFPDGSYVDAMNYCRSPDNDRGGPYCYVNSNEYDWDYCDIPRCIGTES